MEFRINRCGPRDYRVQVKEQKKFLFWKYFAWKDIGRWAVAGGADWLFLINESQERAEELIQKYESGFGDERKVYDYGVL